MLYFNISKLFILRNIAKPRIFLINNGFSYSQAKNIVTYRRQTISARVVEKLCLALSCTPNDLLVWTPDKNTSIPESHPLHKLKPTESINISEILKDVPAEKISEFKSGIEELKSKLKQ
jgi:DNA-binding Xre family transcriptional regulator